MLEIQIIGFILTKQLLTKKFLCKLLCHYAYEFESLNKEITSIIIYEE